MVGPGGAWKDKAGLASLAREPFVRRPKGRLPEVVAVHGSGVPNIDALKAALGGLNLAGLEALKTQGVKKG